MGRAAAERGRRAIAARQAAAGRANVVFAAAPSQNEFLAGLVAEPGDRLVAGRRPSTWTNTSGSTPTTPPRSAAICTNTSSDSAGLGQRPAPPDPRRGGRAAASDLPRLREPCSGRADRHRLRGDRRERPPRVQRPARRRLPRPGPDQGRPPRRTPAGTQQVNDGCFDRIDDVPTHAYTLTVPALSAGAGRLGRRPRPAQGRGRLRHPSRPDHEACPASALRRHAGAHLYLDRESAALL